MIKMLLGFALASFANLSIAAAQQATPAAVVPSVSLPIMLSQEDVPRPRPTNAPALLANNFVGSVASILRPKPAERVADQAPLASPQGTNVPIETMIGQMLLLGFWGDDAGDSWPRTLATQIRDGKVGGVLFLAHNVKSSSGVKSLTKLFQNTGAAVAPFISIDQEGGQVERLNRRVGFAEIPSAWAMAQAGTVQKADAVYGDLARRLRAWGFNTNFGPVLDLNTNPSNPIIGRKNRAFSGRTEIAAKYARTFVDVHRNAGVVTSVKHFPGHGSSQRDSHRGFTDVSATWQPGELEPFRKLIDENRADMVMVGHLFLEQYEPRTARPVPASLSPQVVQGLLRNQLGYDGVVITDDLDMGAIRQHFSPDDTILRAVRAGVDILILSNSARPDVNLPDRVIAMLASAAAQDPAIRRNIERSYWRIMRLKQRLR
ncbi:MAG: glycoside hydrolase family 3 N-terminal domain-containing protein [Pseudomonadota bacterium]